MPRMQSWPFTSGGRLAPAQDHVLGNFSRPYGTQFGEGGLMQTLKPNSLSVLHGPTKVEHKNGE